MKRVKKLYFLITLISISVGTSICQGRPLGIETTFQEYRPAAPIPLERMAIPTQQSRPFTSPSFTCEGDIPGDTMADFHGTDEAGIIIVTGATKGCTYKFSQAKSMMDTSVCVVSTNASFEPQSVTPLSITVDPSGFSLQRRGGSIDLYNEHIFYMCTTIK